MFGGCWNVLVSHLSIIITFWMAKWSAIWSKSIFKKLANRFFFYFIIIIVVVVFVVALSFCFMNSFQTKCLNHMRTRSIWFHGHFSSHNFLKAKFWNGVFEGLSPTTTVPSYQLRQLIDDNNRDFRLYCLRWPGHSVSVDQCIRTCFASEFCNLEFNAWWSYLNASRGPN